MTDVGTILWTPPVRYASMADRIAAHCDRSGGPDACWPWTASRIPLGYGTLGVKIGNVYRTVRAHRTSYEASVGPIPAGLHIDHTCHDPRVCKLRNECPHRRCVNPAHLEAVSVSENLKRGEQGLLHEYCDRGLHLMAEHAKVHGRSKTARYCGTCAQANWRRRDAAKRAARVFA